MVDAPPPPPGDAYALDVPALVDLVVQYGDCRQSRRKGSDGLADSVLAVVRSRLELHAAVCFDKAG